MKMLVDSGCKYNLIDETAWQLVKQKCTLSKTDLKLYPYGCDQPVKLMGKFIALLESDSRVTTTEVYVAKGHAGSLLGRNTAVELGLIKITESSEVSNNSSVNNMASSDPRKSELKKQYPKLFEQRIGIKVK